MAWKSDPMSNRRWNKAEREIQETMILVDYLTAHHMDFDDLDNFSERTVKAAKEWKGGQ